MYAGNLDTLKPTAWCLIYDAVLWRVPTMQYYGGCMLLERFAPPWLPLDWLPPCNRVPPLDTGQRIPGREEPLPTWQSWRL